jgi:hypothetical protein
LPSLHFRPIDRTQRLLALIAETSLRGNPIGKGVFSPDSSGIELLAGDCRGVRISVTARVAVKPELVMTPDALVSTPVVDQIASQFPSRISYKLLRREKTVIKGGIFGPNYG